jgi:hypothetical protein
MTKESISLTLTPFEQGYLYGILNVYNNEHPLNQIYTEDIIDKLRSIIDSNAEREEIDK